jgi:magnesium transporter
MAKDNKVNESNMKIETAETVPEAVARPWFFVALSPSGSILRRNTDSVEDFREMLGGAAISWVDYVARDFDKEMPVVAEQLGFTPQLISALTGESRSTYRDFETEVGMKIPSIQVTKLEVEPNQLMILLKKNLVLTIHPLNIDRRFIRLRRYSETVLRKIPLEANAEDRLTMLLMRIIDENNEWNSEHLREIEEKGDKLNEIMIDPNTPRTQLGPEIYHLKHALIIYLNALWDTVHVLHTLRYGDAELITNDQKLIDKLGVLAEGVSRQISLAEHMSEVLASGLEVLQSIYNNQLQNLNNRLALLMSYLTIIGTAVLVPNTLATMLGNAVFNIGPKDLGWYLAMMIGSTVVATGLVYWWVRKRGWIPKRMD